MPSFVTSKACLLSSGLIAVRAATRFCFLPSQSILHNWQNNGWRIDSKLMLCKDLLNIIKMRDDGLVLFSDIGKTHFGSGMLSTEYSDDLPKEFHFTLDQLTDHGKMHQHMRRTYGYGCPHCYGRKILAKRALIKA
ncbi:hypothetical protein F5J12DRAFT_785480 [Pisolithus orientalis]|uniref:uncharacterized protein n=1 Tax=Pisolithus orientalis TaxID=936130 RepID=UPI0022248A4C|nr:uncharacterized protein F5J12DRAFT_785480 [Pisolithus orientalis]KAI5995975.1 hypothetical protein F5J12DRAFT_785480 [Pisolithus orientalis]